MFKPSVFQRARFAPLALGCLLVLAFGTLFATAAGAQQWGGKGRITGEVTDTEGNKIEGATIILAIDGDGPPPVTTNKKGRWAKAGVRGGLWDVRIEKDGFAASETKVQVSEFATGIDRAHVTTKLGTGGGATATADRDGAAEDAEIAAARTLLTEGNSLLAADDLDGAMAKFSEALPALGDAAKVQVMTSIAQIQVNKGDSAAAVSTLEKALEIDPENINALKVISRALKNSDRAAEAEQYIARLPEDQRADPQELLQQGVDAYNQNDLDAAFGHFDALVSAAPDDPQAYYYRGLVAMAQQNNPQAIADFKKLIELAPADEKAIEGKQFLEYLESQ